MKKYAGEKELSPRLLSDGEREGVLFAFPDFYDPSRRGVHKLVELPGPKLSLLRARRFHRIILFLLPHLAQAQDLHEAEMRFLAPAWDFCLVVCFFFWVGFLLKF